MPATPTARAPQRKLGEVIQRVLRGSSQALNFLGPPTPLSHLCVSSSVRVLLNLLNFQPTPTSAVGARILSRAYAIKSGVSDFALARARASLSCSYRIRTAQSRGAS